MLHLFAEPDRSHQDLADDNDKFAAPRANCLLVRHEFRELRSHIENRSDEIDKTASTTVKLSLDSLLLIQSAKISCPQHWESSSIVNENSPRGYCLRSISDALTTEATAIVLNDPFEGALDLQFIPLFAPGSVRMIYIDVKYDDADNHYHLWRTSRTIGHNNCPSSVTNLASRSIEAIVLIPSDCGEGQPTSPERVCFDWRNADRGVW